MCLGIEKKKRQISHYETLKLGYRIFGDQKGDRSFFATLRQPSTFLDSAETVTRIAFL